MSEFLPKDFSNDETIKWCPGCGDTIILKQFQIALAKSGSIPKKTAIISGIGCSSRLPYYMNTFGFHTIHGRALPIATGFKLSKPEIETWVVTGDGDSLSIGTNHFIHFFRKNIDVKVLLINNQIYGLTKGQYSPTSLKGLKTKTSPYGNIEESINPISLALESGATFLARAIDKNAHLLQDTIIEQKHHKGAALLEIYQNCNIFNDNAFKKYSDKDTKKTSSLILIEGEPLLFGDKDEFALTIENNYPKIIPSKELNDNNIWIHNQKDIQKALLLAKLGFKNYSDFPVVFGIIYKI